MSTQAFTIDLKGLRSIMERRGTKGQAFLELIQNGLDADDVTTVEVLVEREKKGSRWVTITVKDDSPKGFKRLSDAYTLFRKSTKVDDPIKRGMYNLGEKLVIALCNGGATVTSTRGQVVFDVANNTRHKTDKKTGGGSVFQGRLTMTREEQEEAEALVRSVLPPKEIKLTLNGEEIPYREPRRVVEIKALPAMVWCDELDRLKETKRNTTISIVDPGPDEEPYLFVLGLPVMPLYEGQRYHYDVGHRVPTDLERTNVRKAVMRKINARVLEALAEELDEDTASATWVRSALDETPSVETAKAYVEARYGPLDKLARRTPSDPEANHRSTAAGYTVLGGSSLPPKVNAVVREHGLIETSATLTPSHKHLSDKDGVDYPLDKYTEAMHWVCAWAEVLGSDLLGVEIKARVVNDRTSEGERYSACYGGRVLSFNLAVLGRKWFAAWESDRLNEKGIALLVHELAHEAVHNHLSDEFHDECCRLGARLARVVNDEERFVALFRLANAQAEEAVEAVV